MRTYILTGALALATIAGTAVPAISEDDGRWIRKSLRSSCEWWETCKYRYRQVRYWQPTYRSYNEDPYRHLDKCKPAIRVWGEQAQNRENALNRAVVNWTGAVRFQYGEVYIDYSIAENQKVLCTPSSVSDTVTSKLQEKVFNTEYFRCEVQATPCRPRRKDD